MQNLILYNWVIQKTRTMTILSGAEILEGAQGCERTSASALSKILMNLCKMFNFV